jgi:4-diphosphocytidyl-2-C-methyl-D-erythritol kinase
MLTLKAPAKINWFLNVLGLRSDGFHEIQSLIQRVSLFDELTFSPAESLEVNSDIPIPMEQNLVYKAAILLKDKYNVEKGASIHLDKKIPAGAGLGGGSSDAASTLIGLNELWSLGLSSDKLCKAAELIGSDVPFFLYNPLSYADGRGERVSACKARKKINILLVKPSFNISTAWAYQTYAAVKEDERKHEPVTDGAEHSAELTKKAEKVNNITLFIRKIENAEIRELAGIISNDLELIAIKNFPVIAEIKERLLERGALFSLMSGSGSTVFGVFDTKENAEKASQVFDGFWTSVVETIVD